MDSQKILLVNLSKGDLGENNSSLLGAVLVNLILIAALSRRDMTPQERAARQFHLIVDEYQNFASESFSVLQSEARKYAVDLIVAHQYRDQLDELSRGAALNVGNFICFRVTGTDSEELARQFDNTPPLAEMRYEAIRHESPSVPGTFFQDGRAEEKVAQPRRMYSDVAAERANTLANLPPFHGLVKVIEQQQENSRRFRLTEHAIQVFDPHDTDTSEFFGVPDKAMAARIRQRSRELADDRQVVERRFHERTGGRAAFIVPADSGEE
jgi:hypothetical protein